MKEKGKFKVEVFINKAKYGFENGITDNNRRIGSEIQEMVKNKEWTIEEAKYGIDLLSEFFKEKEAEKSDYENEH